MKKGPLDGVKVLDLSQVLSAPFCGMLLADMGAEVIKVERPGSGDISRAYGPYVNDISLYFCQYNRGKKGVAIDMSSESGKRVVMDLVAQVDIVIENFKSGTLEKLGLGYEEMVKVNPGLIYGSISGFGTYGPLSHLPCMDIIAASRSGLVAQSGVDVPVKPGFSLCDTWAGLQLMRGLTMGLLQKQQTNRSVRVDIAMLDCAFYMCEAPVLEHSLTGEFTERTGNHDPRYAPCGEFAAMDGNVMIAVTKEDEWIQLCIGLGLPDLTHDPRFKNNELRIQNRQALINELERATRSMGRYDIEKRMLQFGVPAAGVQTVVEFISTPQTQGLDVIATIDQPGVGKYMAVNTPIRFSKTPVDPHAEAASFPGTHTREILSSLGYSKEKIEELITSGAVFQSAGV